MLKVNVNNYTPYIYPAFTLCGDEISKPINAEYEVGQLVIIDDRSNTGFFEVGVVLGCVNSECGEFRTDYSGMISIDEVRPLTEVDLEDSNIRIRTEMRLELAGHAVKRCWKTNEWIIDLPF